MMAGAARRRLITVQLMNAFSTYTSPIAVISLHSNSEFIVALSHIMLLFIVTAFVRRLSKMRSNAFAFVLEPVFQTSSNCLPAFLIIILHNVFSDIYVFVVVHYDCVHMHLSPVQ